MTQAFDREAFLAAFRAAAKPRLMTVELPGIGQCWVRPLTAGDWIDAHAATAKLEADGVEVTAAMRMAIGLAQNLCGPEGEALFDVYRIEDLRALASLPMESVSSALAKAGEVNATRTESVSPNV